MPRFVHSLSTGVAGPTGGGPMGELDGKVEPSASGAEADEVEEGLGT